MKPQGDIHVDLGQHWLRQWLVAWRHQAIIWINVDLSSEVFYGIQLRAILQVLMNLTRNMCSKFTFLKLIIAVKGPMSWYQLARLMQMLWRWLGDESTASAMLIGKCWHSARAKLTYFTPYKWYNLSTLTSRGTIKYLNERVQVFSKVLECSQIFLHSICKRNVDTVFHCCLFQCVDPA